MTGRLIFVNILGDIVKSMQIPGVAEVQYEPGRTIDIITSLSVKDGGTNSKGKKYPLVAVLLPIKEEPSSGRIKITVRRIVLATLSRSTDNVIKRFSDGGTYDTVLYPMYEEFKKRIAQHRLVVGGDQAMINLVKMDSPGNQPIGEGLNDFVDCIEILNMELLFTIPKIC